MEARLGDAIAKCERGAPACLAFLTPRDCIRAERFLRQKGAWEQAWLWGGFPTAERKCLFLLPDYLLLCLSSPIQQASDGELKELLGDALAEEICPLRIRGSGFRVLTHRDYLGAILGLGIERDALGDLAVQNPHEAILFASQTLASFLLQSLEKVGADTVRCELCEIDEGFTDGKSYRPIRDTVASPRLDCVVAALCGISREKARNVLLEGIVEVDYEVEDRPDHPVSAPCLISVRGYGKYRLTALSDLTKKGRIRLQAEKYI